MTGVQTCALPISLITAQPDYMTKAQKIAKDIADKEATQQKEI